MSAHTSLEMAGFRCQIIDLIEARGSVDDLAAFSAITAALDCAMNELETLKSQNSWMRDLPDGDEKLDIQLYTMAALDLRRWESSRGAGSLVGAAGNPRLGLEDFIARRARQQGRDEGAEERDKLRAELDTARAALVEQIEARQVTEAEGGALQQANNEIDQLRAELARLRSGEDGSDSAPSKSDDVEWLPIDCAPLGEWVTCRNANKSVFEAKKDASPGPWKDRDGLHRDPMKWRPSLRSGEAEGRKG